MVFEKFTGKKGTKDCTSDFKSRMLGEINRDVSRFQELFDTMKEGRGGMDISDWKERADNTKKSAKSKIEKYIDECGAIEIQGKRYSDPDEAFKAEREEVKESGLSMPGEEEYSGGEF